MAKKIIMYGPPLQRITAKIVTPPLPWEVLTADQARQMASVLAEFGLMASSRRLGLYADAVDAMGQPTQIEWSEAA